MAQDIEVKQHDISDCGAACLASVSAYYDLELPISRIRQYAFTDKKGTNVLEMIEAAKKLGFEAKGVKAPIECLKEIPKPAIAHIIVKEQLQHFVVIYKVMKNYILIMDPDDGKLHKKTYEEFQKKWTGVLVLMLLGETFSAQFFQLDSPVQKRDDTSFVRCGYLQYPRTFYFCLYW
jgi:ATP-binding cassette subfamily B protein